MDKLTAVFERGEGDWWIGYVVEIPGARTQGKTLEEVRENLKEAAQLVVEARREIALKESEASGREVIREPLEV
jgi:predicted RNase H-like HicB family nuclease